MRLRRRGCCRLTITCGRWPERRRRISPSIPTQQRGRPSRTNPAKGSGTRPEYAGLVALVACNRVVAHALAEHSPPMGNRRRRRRLLASGPPPLACRSTSPHRTRKGSSAHGIADTVNGSSRPTALNPQRFLGIRIRGALAPIGYSPCQNSRKHCNPVVRPRQKGPSALAGAAAHSGPRGLRPRPPLSGHALLLPVRLAPPICRAEITAGKTGVSPRQIS
ncbi:hypothetical protein CLV78_101484 [Aliiruegeria haliotis]|uniref:Uncharacterized protein n=1 Tax=Aliiruegeria haliotis TaxID=1280846 RepID=A0A2T0RYX6_9RHOB|nr:hypothetical protein CLV78_101484 [Aliiruegeria haliotis]